jgi:predicted transcriptional regulator
VAVNPTSPDTSEQGEKSESAFERLTSGETGAVVVVTALSTIIIIILLNALFSEAGRYGMFTMVAPLYSKLRSDRILDNDIRAQVFDYVKTNPGDHFRSIMSSLKLTNGTLAYHLATLEREEMIKSERDGGYKRFYPRGRNFTEDVIEINGLQKQILDVIADNPGLSQKKIAMVLGTSTPTVSYHIKALKAARLIEVRREGKLTRCYISKPAA